MALMQGFFKKYQFLAIGENADNIFRSIKTFKLLPYIVYIIGSIFGLDLDQPHTYERPCLAHIH